MPRRSTRWPPTFAALHVILGLAHRSAKRSDLQNSVDAVRLLGTNKALFASADIYVPPLGAGTAAWPQFLEWAVDYTRLLAGGTVTPRETRREIIRDAARRDLAVLRRLGEHERK